MSSYSFINFLPFSREYDTRPFFDEFKLPGVNKAIARPVTMLASSEVLARVYAEPEPFSLTSESVHPNTPETTALMAVNEHVIATSIGSMLADELRIRLRTDEIELVVDRPQTPAQMIIDALKTDIALIQMYLELIATGKFDRTNQTLMQSSEAVALRITEALRQVYIFADVPELPLLARKALDAFLEAVKR